MRAVNFYNQNLKPEYLTVVEAEPPAFLIVTTYLVFVSVTAKSKETVRLSSLPFEALTTATHFVFDVLSLTDLTEALSVLFIAA